MPQRLRALREHDGWWQFAYVMLMQAVALAEGGDEKERCWLLEASMSEACYLIVGLDPDTAREALREKWRTPQ